MKTKSKIIIGVLLTTLLIATLVFASSFKTEEQIRQDSIAQNIQIQNSLASENDKLRASSLVSKSKIDSLQKQLDIENQILNNLTTLIESNSNEWNIRNDIISSDKERINELHNWTFQQGK